MSLEHSKTWAKQARAEAMRALERADEIITTDSIDRARIVADELIASADQLRRDARYARLRLDVGGSNGESEAS